MRNLVHIWGFNTEAAPSKGVLAKVKAIRAFMKPILAMLLVFCASLSSELRGAAPEATPAPASTPAPPPSAPAKRSAAELEKLAIPIALHPDPLISIILPAAVYPVEIVMAARFVTDTNNIAKVDSQPWDENVKAVARFPELVAKMSADLEWTVALGQAFLEQRKELLDTIQALRVKAQKAGTLQTTPQQIVTVTNTLVEKTVEQQVVVVTNTIVQIQPSNPEVIYVPSYPPTVYYPPVVYPYGYAYYGYGYYPYAPLVTFGAGMFWGAAISHWNHCNWHGGDIDIDIDRNTNINRNRNSNINRPQPRSGDRAGNLGSRQSWQPDQGRLQRSGAPTAKTRDARGWSNQASSGIRQSLGSGGARPSQQPSLGGGQRSGNRPQTQPTRSPSAGQRPSTAQRPTSSFNRATPQRSSAFNGVGSGGSTRNFSNRGSSSRGGGGFSGGRAGGARGGGGGGGGGRR